LVVPLFQRHHVWTQESQWEQLWEDITRVAERMLGCRELVTGHSVVPPLFSIATVSGLPLLLFGFTLQPDSRDARSIFPMPIRNIGIGDFAPRSIEAAPRLTA